MINCILLSIRIIALFPNLSKQYIPFNIQTLRAIRVLRPLKLVSGIPSRFIHFQCIFNSTTMIVMMMNECFNVYTRVS